MTGKVLTTDTAKQAIQQIQNTINNQLQGAISDLDAKAKTLSDTNVWAGPLADKFRAEWPSTKAALDKAQTELTELRQTLDTISKDIFAAGGQN